MDGGVLSIPFDKLREFYDMYVQCVLQGEKVFVVEQKTETYNFFIDIDYKDDEALTVPEVQSIMQIVCDKVRTVSSVCALVSVAEPKPKDGKIKTGIHANWPGFVVNQHGAIQMMHHLISILNKVYPSRDWSRDIDASVYGEEGKQGSGFRLPWSHKKCKGETEGEYLPIFLYENGVLKDMDQEPSYEKLMMATVRTESREVQEVPECVVLCRPIRKEGNFTPGEIKNEVNDSELSAILETYIRQFMDGQKETRVQKIFKFKTKYFIKTNSKFCENIKREHSSNHVKLVINPPGYERKKFNKEADAATIHQECFCRCDGARPCKDFMSTPYRLPSSITKILYPPAERKKCLFKK